MTSGSEPRGVALILAAGAGRRAGGPKALLALGGRTLLSRAVELYRRDDIAASIVVLGCEAERVQRDAGLPSNVRIVVNADWDQGGMLSSVISGLGLAESLSASAAILHPVDHPAVEPETIDQVLAALGSGARIVVPTWEGRRGHPAAFSAEAFPALRAAPQDQGARAVLRAHPDWIVTVRGGPGCLAGVNTLEDLRALEASPDRG